ncbi:hypothetical protein OUZ56_026141 [Daphnia magna]|uniref:Uncharacterized protein n=1 Tax=Daphnia magna TaxID=35525 RepID=A0ABQ9ZKY8_9CRUS|nr:hypothetical protein OUZ56_026141 [Daphnia magna]
MTSVKKMTTFPSTCMVIKARMSRSQYQLLPGFPFLFTPSKELPEGITVDQFLGETNDKGEYNLLIRYISSKLINLPRGILLGNVETACQLIGKIDVKDENDTMPNEEQAEIDTYMSNVEFQYKKPLIKLLNDFKDIFASTDSQLGYRGVRGCHLG